MAGTAAVGVLREPDQARFSLVLPITALGPVPLIVSRRAIPNRIGDTRVTSDLSSIATGQQTSRFGSFVPSGDIARNLRHAFCALDCRRGTEQRLARLDRETPHAKRACLAADRRFAFFDRREGVHLGVRSERGLVAVDRQHRHRRLARLGQKLLSCFERVELLVTNRTDADRAPRAQVIASFSRSRSPLSHFGSA